jgi:hypothetical protein
MRKTWTSEQEKFLVENYSDKGPLFCAQELNRPVVQVRDKAHKLKIKTSKIFYLARQEKSKGRKRQRQRQHYSERE